MANRFLLHLIRHAQSANNALPESQRVEDPGLTSAGHQQATLLAHRFAGEAVTRILTSGFLRAILTTRPLARALNQRPAIWTDLHEVGGCYRGHRIDELEGRPGLDRTTLRAEFPEFEVPPDITDSGWWRSRTFETHEQARTRASRMASRLLDEFQGSAATVACVIHADFKALLLQALLQSAYHEYAYADLVNTSVSTLSIASDKIEVVAFNDAGHLPQDIVTS